MDTTVWPPVYTNNLEVDMLKGLVAGTALLVITGSSVLYAQQAPGGAPVHEHWKPSAADWDAFTDARIAALRAGLQLTPDQAKNWPVVEQAIRDMAKARQERLAGRQNDQQRR